MAGLCNVTIFNVLFLIRCVVQTARFTTIQFNRKLVEHTIQTEDVGKYQIEVTIPTFMEINRREKKKVNVTVPKKTKFAKSYNGLKAFILQLFSLIELYPDSRKKKITDN